MSRMDPARRFSHTPKIIFLFFWWHNGFIFIFQPHHAIKISKDIRQVQQQPSHTDGHKNQQRPARCCRISAFSRWKRSKKKASKKLPYNYEKKTTRRKKHNTNPTARVGQGWSGLGNTRRRASPIEAAACSETSWSFIYWRDFKRRKRKVIFFLHNISCFDGGLKKPLTAQLESSLLSLPLVYETPPADYSSTSVNWIEGDYDAFWITDSLDRWFAFDWGKFVLRKFALIAC